jgi:hypothetical protein
MTSTKRTDVEIKPVDATSKKGGRPRVFAHRRLSNAERNQRSRDKQKHSAAKVKAEDVLASLMRTRRITEPIDKLVAVRGINALIDGKIAEGIRALEQLPPPVRLDDGSPTHSFSDAKARVLQMIANAVAADQTELAARAAAGETLPERDALLLRLHEIDAASALPDADKPAAAEPGQPTERERALLEENARLRERLGDAPAKLVAPGDQFSKAVDPPPPSDQAAKGARQDHLSTNPLSRLTPADADMNHRPVVVLDIEPTPLGLVDEPAKPAAAAPTPEPAPQPTEPGMWDRSESGRAWREWVDQGNYLLFP